MRRCREAARVFRLRLSEAKFVEKQVLDVALDRKIGDNAHIRGGEHWRPVFRLDAVLHDGGFQPRVGGGAVPVLLHAVVVQQQDNGKECGEFFFGKSVVLGQQQQRQVAAGTVKAGSESHVTRHTSHVTRHTSHVTRTGL